MHLFLSKRKKISKKGQEYRKKGCNLAFVVIYYLSTKQWPIGQAVKTLASHAGNSGSIPGWVTRERSTSNEVLFSFSGDPSAHLPAQNASRFGFGFAYPTRRSTSSLVRRRVWVYSPQAKFPNPFKLQLSWHIARCAFLSP